MTRHRSIALLLLNFAAGAVQAHPGHGELTFWNNLLHPLTGLDQLLAMVAVGLLAALRDERLPRAVRAGAGAGIVAAGAWLFA